MVRQCLESVVQSETGAAKYGGIINHDGVVENFRKNAVPVELLDGDLEDYDEFLVVRRTLMAKKIRDYYFSL